MKLRLTPLTLKQANELVSSWHRHHKPVVGHRFSIGVSVDGEYVGAAITGRPVGRETSQYTVAEVTRLVTDGTTHACSKLYSASARAAQAMGFERIQTFILESEAGTSLKASGWYRIKSNGAKCDCNDGTRDGLKCKECNTDGGDWNHSWRKGRRTDQPMVPKQRWGKTLNESVENGNREEPASAPFGGMTLPCVENTANGKLFAKDSLSLSEHYAADDGYCSCGVLCETGTGFREHLRQLSRVKCGNCGTSYAQEWAGTTCSVCDGDIEAVTQ